jgi:hypothetical protein
MASQAADYARFAGLPYPMRRSCGSDRNMLEFNYLMQYNDYVVVNTFA